MLGRLALSVTGVLCLLAGHTEGSSRPRNLGALPGIPLITEPATTANPNGNATFWFDQLIDHNAPEKGTFKQRYWFNPEFYQEGGPIVLMTPGEANAAPYTGYLTNAAITGLIAQQENGTVIILEHRFYGLSNPFPDLTSESLKVHTIAQAVDDLDYFARNVKLPQANGDRLGPDFVPWINVGGSYSGALVSWARHVKPDLFWAGYASSAVVETILDFWQYFEPERIFMPKNCSADVHAVIEHVDQVFQGNNTSEIQALKENWGLGDMSSEHLDDVAGALRNNLWDWQSLQPNSGPNATFFAFCDALEVKDGKVANESGWGVEHALPAWGQFWKDGYLANLCGDRSNEDCLGTYDADNTFYTNTTIDNAWRSWNWIVCNEVGYLQEGTPDNIETLLVSKLIQPPYELRQCQLMFPDAFSEPPTPDVNATIATFGGWDVKQDRTFYANGLRDPWRYTTLSAPASPAQNSSSQPIGLSDGFHCSDLKAANAEVDPTVAEVQRQALGFIGEWITKWTPPANSTQKRASRATIESQISSREVPELGRTLPVTAPKAVNAWFRGF